MTDETGFETGMAILIDSWIAGPQHNVTADWGDGTVTLVVDGKAAGTANLAGALALAPEVCVSIGPAAESSAPPDTVFRNFKLYEK